MAERFLTASSGAFDGSSAAASDPLEEGIQFPLPVIDLPSYPRPLALGTDREELSMGDSVFGGSTGNLPRDLHMADEILHLVEVTTRGEPEYERYRRGYTQ